MLSACLFPGSRGRSCQLFGSGGFYRCTEGTLPAAFQVPEDEVLMFPGMGLASSQHESASRRSSPWRSPRSVPISHSLVDIDRVEDLLCREPESPVACPEHPAHRGRGF